MGWSIEHHAGTYSVLTHTLNLWFRFYGKNNGNHDLGCEKIIFYTNRVVMSPNIFAGSVEENFDCSELNDL